MIKGNESAMSHEGIEGKGLLELKSQMLCKGVMPLSSNNRLMTSKRTDNSKRHDHTQ